MGLSVNSIWFSGDLLFSGDRGNDEEEQVAKTLSSFSDDVVAFSDEACSRKEGRKEIYRLIGL